MRNINNEKLNATIRMKTDGNVTNIRTISEKSKLDFSIVLPRNISSLGVTIELTDENFITVKNITADWIKNCRDKEIFQATLFCKDLFFMNRSLLYYRVAICTEKEKLYINSPDFTFINNSDCYSFALTSNVKEAYIFKLLKVGRNTEYPPPPRGCIYHIFVDRFCKDGKSCRQSYINYNDDWYHGIPEYQNYTGEPIANDTHFGGTLYGIIEKLPYLYELGVEIIYLSPIFKAKSNHKYDTGDYETVDPAFGGEEALQKLINEAGKIGIKIILDGVFSHTGDDSKYFNKYGNYDSLGAYQSKNSRYYKWYTFYDFPKDYKCWWNIGILPEVNELEPSYKEYICGENGILSKYLDMGVYGFRLDVSDELPDEFIREIKKSVKGLLIGEVWENAADKHSYGKLKKYFTDDLIDGVTNYPVKNGIISFLKYGNTEDFSNTLFDIYTSYPKENALLLMNIIGTHDTIRAITELSGAVFPSTPAEASRFKLTEKQKETARKRLKTALLLQCTLPGIPTVYYGDEIALEGLYDPFNRRPFPWGVKDDITADYKKIISMRKNESALIYGDFKIIYAGGNVLIFERKEKSAAVRIIINNSDKNYIFLNKENSLELYSLKKIRKGYISVKPSSFLVLKYVA